MRRTRRRRRRRRNIGMHLCSMELSPRWHFSLMAFVFDGIAWLIDFALRGDSSFDEFKMELRQSWVAVWWMLSWLQTVFENYVVLAYSLQLYEKSSSSSSSSSSTSSSTSSSSSHDLYICSRTSGPSSVCPMMPGCTFITSSTGSSAVSITMFIIIIMICFITSSTLVMIM